MNVSSSADDMIGFYKKMNPYNKSHIYFTTFDKIFEGFKTKDMMNLISELKNQIQNQSINVYSLDTKKDYISFQTLLETVKQLSP